MDTTGEPRRPDTAGAEAPTAADDPEQAGWAAPPGLRRPPAPPEPPRQPWPAQAQQPWPAPAPPAQGQPVPARWQPAGQWQPPPQVDWQGRPAMPWAGRPQANRAGQALQPPPVSGTTGPDTTGSDDSESDGSDRKDRTRRRVMIGGAATVGVVAVIAIGQSTGSGDVVIARCVDDRNVVVEETPCPDPGRASSSVGSGGYGTNPLFSGGARQYHYSYGGTGGYGEVAAGGTDIMPKKVTIVTLSGRTLVQRGGFGQSTSHRSSGS